MATFPTPQFDALTITAGGAVTGITSADVGAVPTTAEGAASGVATLDAGAHLVATQFPALTGDITTTAGSTATALKAVGTAGTYGSASVIPVITTDAEGRVSNVTLATAAATVSSVALAAPSIFTVTGSPVTSAGTLTLTLSSQAQNEIFASPNGAAGAPGFRSLVLGDLPAGVGELAAAQTWTGANTYTEGLQINGLNANGGQVVLNLNGTGYNTILRNDNSSFFILLSGSTGGSFNSFRPFAIDLSTAALSLDGSGAGATFGGAIYNHIGTVAAYSAVAPSAVTVGASPWVYQNTNAYGVFLHIYGVTAAGSSLQVSKDNSTYVTVASGGGDESTYVPPGFYAKFTFSTAPSGASIVPI